MNESNLDLIELAVDGDEQALSSLLEKYGPAVRQGLASEMPRRFRSLLSEDDVMQQSYVDAFKDIRRFAGNNERAFAGWLKKLARRNLLDAIKMLEAEKRGGSRRRIEAPATEQSMVALYERLGGTMSTPSHKAARGEATDKLKDAIESLPEDYRNVVQMYDIEMRPIEEVCEALNRSSGAVYMLRARAHRLLCELMGTVSNYLTRTV